MRMADEEFKSILFTLSNEMNVYDLQNLKHLCRGKIPLGVLAKANNTRDSFRIMRQKLLILNGKFD